MTRGAAGLPWNTERAKTVWKQWFMRGLAREKAIRAPP